VQRKKQREMKTHEEESLRRKAQLKEEELSRRIREWVNRLPTTTEITNKKIPVQQKLTSDISEITDNSIPESDEENMDTSSEYTEKETAINISENTYPAWVKQANDEFMKKREATNALKDKKIAKITPGSAQNSLSTDFL